jgi:hypothetical protein
MDRSEFEHAIGQLTAAAELLARGGTEESRMNAFQLLGFFRLQAATARLVSTVHTANDELFGSTAQAALLMAGRKEFSAAAALLDQAHEVLTS